MYRQNENLQWSVSGWMWKHSRWMMMDDSKYALPWSSWTALLLLTDPLLLMFPFLLFLQFGQQLRDCVLNVHIMGFISKALWFFRYWIMLFVNDRHHRCVHAVLQTALLLIELLQSPTSRFFEPIKRAHLSVPCLIRTFQKGDWSLVTLDFVIV